ncbi:hypothetical protein KY289_025778 [Solanum tuberosum]|nr:hypothetical protein KY289_025778 [Solanum tuberosum]
MRIHSHPSSSSTEAQASGFVDTDLTAEAVWPNITKGRRSNITNGEWSIKIKEEQVEEDGVMNDVGNGDDHVLMWHIWKEENDRWMEENHSLYLYFYSQNEFMTETTEQPSDLIIPLLRYQKEWLAWALKQEESIARGRKAILDSDFLSPAPYILPAVKGTLVICRVVAVIEWVNEIDRFTIKGSNTILVYHGANREKNIGSNTTRAILALESSYKWALSGTPQQNCVGELTKYILTSGHVCFLQIIPYSYYFCEDCDCRALENSVHIATTNLFDTFAGGIEFGRDAMVLLKHKILKTIMLRHTKKGRAVDLGLPPRIVTLRKDCFDVKEEDYYRSL